MINSLRYYQLSYGGKMLRPYLTEGQPPTTSGVLGLSVFGMGTGVSLGYRHLTLNNPHSKLNIYILKKTLRCQYSQLLWISPRAISISPLHVSPHFHF